MTYSGDSAEREGHERATRQELGRRLAALTRFIDGGEYDPQTRYEAPLYFLPSDTLMGDTASGLGIRSERNLFGGVVPHPFVATKTITHNLQSEDSYAPHGWRAEFPRKVADVVLEGFSAFGKEDAMLVGRKLLAFGPVRIKLATGVAGHGQFVADTPSALVGALDPIDAGEIRRSGLVVEQNLSDVTTYSVGQIGVADTVVTYYGMQHLTTNNHDAEVYGGSEIFVVRGDFDALLGLRLLDNVRLAITQARIYDRAAAECFEGFFASRRNYDVAQGRDAAGKLRSGVLEQSWRAGGASGAEIAAFEAFQADPSLNSVRAMTREVYGEPPPALPANAAIYFAGADPRVGPLTKFAWAETHANPR